MNDRENCLRAVRFEKPERIPTRFVLNEACWHHYPQVQLAELMASHPLLFPGFQMPSSPIVPEYTIDARRDEPLRDSWGCLRETTDDGIVGTVTEHPLANWDNFEGYSPPDPDTQNGLGPVDWDRVAEQFAAAPAAGRLATGGLRHGHTFLALCDIRGYENLLFDMTDGDDRLGELIRMVEQFNLALVNRRIELGAEWMNYPEDLGMQVGPMLSPEHFRRYIKPTYGRLMAPARRAGCIVHMHSDGDIRTLVDDLIDGGVEVLNLQDLVNGIDWIQQRLAGRTCIDLDVDRQSVTRFGAPAQVDALIREAVQKLGSREGGLMMTHGLCPGPPLENVKALMDAMERYATYYA